MRKEGLVSLWIGNTKSNEDLSDFLEITYNEDGDYIPSHFAKGFKTGRYDDDFREARYYQHLLSGLKQLSKTFTNYDIVIPRFEKIIEMNPIEQFNAVIFLYNFDYELKLKYYSDGTNIFTYIGTVEYK